MQHFPPENDPAAHRELKRQFRNLDMVVDEESRGEHLCATSIGNLVRLCRPVVVLDEGHKATSPLALQTIEGFNASIVVELTATPREVRGNTIEYRPNIVSRVTGQELLDEEMIKLRLDIATSGQKSWHDVLTQARDKRDALAAKAVECADAVGPDRMIRPIVLVQAERTGEAAEVSA